MLQRVYMCDSLAWCTACVVVRKRALMDMHVLSCRLAETCDRHSGCALARPRLWRRLRVLDSCCMLATRLLEYHQGSRAMK